jgi:peptidoglycan/xylan/chitin deacetylase (PgdA/CDA1 family)
MLDWLARSTRPATGIPILMYHEISFDVPTSFRKYVVGPRAFTTQMRWLRAAGYTPISLAAFLAGRTDPSGLPRRAVIITFDDGFRHCMQYAPEILERLGFRATFFFVAGMIGDTSRWLVDDRGVELPLADWARVRELHAAGFECGAHSLTHPRLASLSDDDCRHELESSRDILQNALGCRVVHLAYPYGSYSGRVRELAADAGYESACTVDVGLATPSDDPLALRRVPVSGDDALPDFIWRLRTGFSLHERYERWWHRWRS